MTANTLSGEYQFYLAERDALSEKYPGRVIVIKDHEVLGEYDTHLAAFTETVKHHERGTFLIQEVSQAQGAYVATFYTPGVLPD
jgi:hypothetical protein